ncbi:uncharacterized protein HMPREF1541_05326 [Cyphellophora europaea CBS 101466]|uniref:Dolichyl-diphosphooligosaccharide--protein glycosyltransferase subunit 1 n=1 Tax=Cyphellophora europaea (strain CBS 101466) TaxID=1220924 RepID=W2RTQ9_CYPE1|nr:uncharacterized protein HMPREF1541_05326 [Cyphellophora europaea CBS 101466]ETN39104.1 hypothetical protein HMPREF1541_05326 [Cyphellophora europaea CBS 101466]
MRLGVLGAAISLLLGTSLAESNLTTPQSTRQILQGDFKPPQVWENANLVRNTNLEKSYVRETVNLVIKNTDKSPQSEYYFPFDYDVIGNVGGFEVRNRNDDTKTKFKVTTAALAAVLDGDVSSKPTQYFVIHLPTPVQSEDSITLSISYHLLNSLMPLPAAIKQDEKQYLTYSFSAYFPSAYPTLKQKTKLKSPSADVPEYSTTKGLTKSADPTKEGSALTYGPYDTTTPPFTSHPVTVRYEFTKPVLLSTTLSRSLEVSHWGGNLATEDHYALTNTGAHLSNHFSRVSWATQNFYVQSNQISTPALRQLNLALPALSADPYYTDDIGNVSTSRFRPTPRTSPTRPANLELKPRYPLFGGWNYTFRIGWNAPLSSYVRALAAKPSTYVLRAPLLSPPVNPEGLSIGAYSLDVLLPEGATIQSHEIVGPSLPDFEVEEGTTKTFMDTTLGRTRLTLKARNVVDEIRDAELLVTYEYTTAAALRKPLSIVAGFVAVFVVLWAVGQLDTSIGKKKVA